MEIYNGQTDNNERLRPALRPNQTIATRKDFILANHSQVKMAEAPSASHEGVPGAFKIKNKRQFIQRDGDGQVAARMKSIASTKRIRQMNESAYGLSTESVLSKDGFIKSYSKPSNPGRAKNFTNPPDYQIYFAHSQLAAERRDLYTPGSTSVRKSTANREANLTQTGIDKGSSLSKRNPTTSFFRSKNKQQRSSELTSTRTFDSSQKQQHQQVAYPGKVRKKGILMPMAETVTEIIRGGTDLAIPLKKGAKNKANKITIVQQRTQAEMGPQPMARVNQNTMTGPNSPGRKPNDQQHHMTTYDYDELQSTTAGHSKSLGRFAGLPNTRSGQLKSIQDTFRNAVDSESNQAIQTFNHAQIKINDERATAKAFLSDQKHKLNQKHMSNAAPHLESLTMAKPTRRTLDQMQNTGMSRASKSAMFNNSRETLGSLDGIKGKLTGPLKKGDGVKLRGSLIDRLNELIIKKQLDDRKDPKDKMWDKEYLLTNSMQAVALHTTDPISVKKHLHKEFKSANTRIQKHYQEIKKTRQTKLDVENWVSSFSAQDESYNQRMIQRTDNGQSSASVIHDFSNNFRGDKSIVNHVTQMGADQQVAQAQGGGLGLNHIMRAKYIEEENERLENQRKTGAGRQDIEKQNEMFPNNIEYRMKKKLASQRPDKPQEVKTLEQKLATDEEALNHQRYLIDGVIKTISTKRLNYASASKNLLKNKTEKWLRKRDTSTEMASIGMSKGAFFGTSKPLKKPLQVTQSLVPSEYTRD